MTNQDAIDYLTALWNSDDLSVDETIALGMAIKALETHEERTETHACESKSCETHEERTAEPCEDCISRRAAIEYFMTNTNWHDEDGDEIDDADEKRKLLEDYFSGVPSVTPAREKGKWIWNKRTGDYECSECGCNPIYERTTPDCSEIDKYKFCRWCGADMRGEQTLKYADNDTAKSGLQSAT